MKNLPFKASLSSLPGPVVAPLNLRVSDIESNQVTVHWDAVAYDSIMGEMKEYKVCTNSTVQINVGVTFLFCIMFHIW